MSREIPNGEWMHWFLGASEDDVIKGKDKFVDADRCNLKHPSTDQLWPMGVFEQPSVAEMRRRVELLEVSRRSCEGQRASEHSERSVSKEQRSDESVVS